MIQVGLKRLRSEVGDIRIGENEMEAGRLITDYRRGLMETKDFIFEILKFCEEP